MPTTFGTYQSDLLTALSAAMTGYTWYPGMAPDVLEDASGALGYVWVTHSERDDADKLIMMMTGQVRVYPLREERFDAVTPTDPAPLYQAVDDLQAALRPVQAPVGGSPWFFEVVTVTADHDTWQVDAEVISSGPNLFALS